MTYSAHLSQCNQQAIRLSRGWGQDVSEVPWVQPCSVLSWCTLACSVVTCLYENEKVVFSRNMTSSSNWLFWVVLIVMGFLDLYWELGFINLFLTFSNYVS